MNRALYFGLGGCIMGAIISWIIYSQFVYVNSQPINSSPPLQHTTDMQMKNEGTTMIDMVENLKNKSGDEFDKEFILSMIEHHNGAIEMAKLVEKNGKHEELKDMAKDVINTQGSEIEKMKQWQKNWNY